MTANLPGRDRTHPTRPPVRAPGPCSSRPCSGVLIPPFRAASEPRSGPSRSRFGRGRNRVFGPFQGGGPQLRQTLPSFTFHRSTVPLSGFTVAQDGQMSVLCPFSRAVKIFLIPYRGVTYAISRRPPSVISIDARPFFSFQTSALRVRRKLADSAVTPCHHAS